MSSVGSFRFRLKSRLTNKPRSPPDSAGSCVTLESPAESEKCSTPYRLPRISSPRDTPCTTDSPMPLETEEKVWGRFGYEDEGPIRMPELGPTIHKATMNMVLPVTPGSGAATMRASSRSMASVRRYRHTAMAVPKFRNAAITPSCTPSMIRDMDDVSLHVYKNFLEKTANKEQHLHNPAPTPTPNSRSVSPAKSTKSIHWTLGNNRHMLFDFQGRGRNQGPYSREFTVRCMAPASWMRMKWGRPRVSAH